MANYKVKTYLTEHTAEMAFDQSNGMTAFEEVTDATYYTDGTQMWVKSDVFNKTLTGQGICIADGGGATIIATGFISDTGVSIVNSECFAVCANCRYPPISKLNTPIQFSFSPDAPEEDLGSAHKWDYLLMSGWYF